MTTTLTFITRQDASRAKRQRGISLLELIAALAVIAAILLGALALYSSASSSQNAIQLSQDVTSLRAATRQLFQGQGSYGAAGANLNQILIDSNRIPSTISVNGATLTNVLGGPVDVFARGNGKFGIRVQGLPTAVCVALATSKGDWDSVSVNSEPITDPVITPAIASAACQDDDGTNNIELQSN